MQLRTRFFSLDTKRVMDLVSSQPRGEIPVLSFSENEKQTPIART
jgi:hypothetical protein